MKPAFEPTGARYRLNLSDEERGLLRSLPAELRGLLGTDDPSLRRLFPPAYEEDPQRQKEYEELVREDLLASRTAALEVVDRSVDSDELSEDELMAWIRVLNDLRLVLGTRLDVSEDMDDEVMLSGPDGQAYALYHFLGWLQEQGVAALATSLNHGDDRDPSL